MLLAAAAVHQVKNINDDSCHCSTMMMTLLMNSRTPRKTRRVPLHDALFIAASFSFDGCCVLLVRVWWHGVQCSVRVQDSKVDNMNVLTLPHGVTHNQYAIDGYLACVVFSCP